MSVRKQRGKYLVDVKMMIPSGETVRVRKTSPIQTRRGAEQYERELRQALLDGRWKKEDKSQETDVPLLRDFVPEYLARCVAINKPSTIETKKSILVHHILPRLGSRRLDQIRTRELDRFVAEVSDSLSPKSTNNVLNLARNLLAVAQEWEIIETVPRVNWVKVPEPDFRFLDFGEAERLVAAAAGDSTWYTMVVVALNTGLRQGELLALRWKDVDLKAGRLVVKQNVARGVVGTPKNGRSREVPLNDRVLAALRQHRHLRGELVFCQEDGSMLTKNMCRRPLARLRQRAGLIELGWHDLRHTFASHLVMRGVSLKAVQELLGHATIEMTMRYAHLSPNVTRDAVRALDPAPQGQHGGNTQPAAKKNPAG